MATRSVEFDRGSLYGVFDFLRRRLIELTGLGLIAAGAALLLAIGSYSPSDPSLNSASTGAIRNLAGRPGAIAADLALQSLGLAACLLAIVFALWGWRILAHHSLPRWWLRVTGLPLTLIALSAVFAAAPEPAAWPIHSGIGGAVGQLVLTALLRVGAAIGLALSVSDAALLLLPFTAIGVYNAMTLSLAEWRQVGRGARGTFQATRAVWRFLSGLMRRAIGKPHRRLKIEPGLRASESPEYDDPSLYEEEEDPPALAPRRGTLEGDSVVAPRQLPAKRRAKQTSLDFALKGDYRPPSLELLREPVGLGARTVAINEEALTQNARMLESVLEEFGVNGEIVKVRPGPVVALYELEPAPGTKTARVIGLADDIARSMSAVSARVAVIPGRNAIGIELPNARRETVYLRELLAADSFEAPNVKLGLALGKDIGGTPVVADLARMPHLLIAGTTGSGKSVAINTMIMSLVYRHSPAQCRFIMIDPKMLELSVYDGIPHLLAPVVTDAKKAVVALKWTVREMENRYRNMSKLGVRNIDGYNARLAEARRKGETLTRRVQVGFDPETGEPNFEDQPLDLEDLPYIVVIVDEMADLMLVAGKDIEAAVQRLAQMARAAGIHLVMATQRPSVDVITGTIKANFPTRISFQVTSKIDSRTILGEQGAEQLLGQGDMLFMQGGGRIQRVHGPFITDSEVEEIVSHLKALGSPSYLEEVTEDDDVAVGIPGFEAGESSDELYDQAVALVLRERKVSTSFVQRHLQIGYNRAARIVERMESEGLVSPANHVGKREILVPAREG
jgi:DNA segregation ATPase FtsK/SpoIIIE, S-DNA-T family